MTRLMRRWTMDAIGRDRLRFDTAPVPTPGAGELLVRVRAVSLNYRDKLVIDGAMQPSITFPFTPVSDAAGVVEAVGAGAVRFKPGDRVITRFIPGWIDGRPSAAAAGSPAPTLGGALPGVLADYVAFPEDWFSAGPRTLDDVEASTLPVAALTAWTALVELGGLKAGQTVLVQGTGGVALFGLQIAKAQGARVIVTSRGPEKLERARGLGADQVIDSQATDWAAECLRLTDGRGADHILELIGGANLGHSLKALSVGGRVSVIGVLSGWDVSASAGPLLLKSATVQGVMVGHGRAQEDLIRAVDQSGLKPVVERRFSLSDFPLALDHLDRGPFGKIVVEMI